MGSLLCIRDELATITKSLTFINQKFEEQEKKIVEISEKLSV